MGCDIHFVIEMKTKTGWVGVYSTDLTPRLRTDESANGDGRLHDRGSLLRDRDYGFFASVATVRGEVAESVPPLGVPDDCSELAQMDIDWWDTDGHSHSHMPLLDFAARKLQLMHELVAWKLQGEQATNPNIDRVFDLAGVSKYDIHANYRVVFWFDN